MMVSFETTAGFFKLLDKLIPRSFHEPLGTDMDMRWFKLSEIGSLDLFPALLRENLKNLPTRRS